MIFLYKNYVETAFEKGKHYPKIVYLKVQKQFKESHPFTCYTSKICALKFGAANKQNDYILFEQN
jgi:hypothetical protein